MTAPVFKRVLIIADIEGSSDCWSHRASSFMTRDWVPACIGMSRDVDAVARALFSAGAKEVTVKDFHRTGFNLIPGLIDPRAGIVPGYCRGPVPGIGNPNKAEALFLIGMHAASGSHGFLSHTFTSRIQRLTVNGHLMPEVAFFSGSVAGYGIRPVFFSGCPVACGQAHHLIPGIRTFSIDKSGPPERFEAEPWRNRLGVAAAAALTNHCTRPYLPKGPFRAVVLMRDGAETARRLAARWGFERSGARIIFNADDFAQLYMAMIRLCYLSPASERVLPLGLFLYHLMGRIGLAWVRRRALQQGLL
ncbi:hypothetical protein D3OALGB2SA_2329 [Olavius algarvensis associated proteobacterium Delta 3]|nr:hypothetical protein D3OALGB2SA_2329 [Olavius algarvensis associated proteobacterium Delta 3]